MARPDTGDPVLERRRERPSDRQPCAVLRKGFNDHSYRRGGDVSIAFSHGIARATSRRWLTASRAFVQVYANHRMRRFLRRRKRRTGLGKYRDYNDEHLYKEIGLVCIVGRGSFQGS